MTEQTMYPWIIEADIVRLQKQLRVVESSAEKKKLLSLLEVKRAQLPDNKAVQPIGFTRVERQAW